MSYLFSNLSKLFLLLFCFFYPIGKGYCYDTIPPARLFMLTDWKLQLPGPEEIKQIPENYFSHYFYGTVDSVVCFQLDAAEKGHTANSEFVRSELRHRKDWAITSSHSLSAKIRVEAKAEANKVTVLQIHGINPDHSNAPPLLRIAFNDHSLYAFIKTDITGANTEKIFLQQFFDSNYIAISILTNNGTLKIYTDNQLRVERDLHFWSYLNYFKIGCYPQVKSGFFKVLCKDVNVQ